MNISTDTRVKMVRIGRVTKVAVLVVLVLNAIFTAALVNHAGVELAWTAMNKGKVHREMVRVDKLAVEGAVVSPVPLE